MSVDSPRSVGVVIVTWRSAELTLDALRSLAAERETSRILLRVVVVDNASGDFARVAEGVAQSGYQDWVRVCEAPINGGFAYGNNFGFARLYEEGVPDYVHLLNPDTVVLPGAIRALVDFLDTHPDVGIAGSSFENGDGSDWPIAFRFPSLISEFEGGLSLGIISTFLYPWHVSRVMSRKPQPMDWGAGASMMIRPSVLSAVGGLDERFFLYFEEVEFFWRAKRAGFPAWYVPESRVIHIAGQSTGVTTRGVALKRLPAYWFESRRRYYVLTNGLWKAMLIDVVSLAAHGLGRIRLRLQGRQDRIVPHFLEDLWTHSVLRRENRVVQPPKVDFLAAR